LVYVEGASGVVRQFDVETETTTDLVTLEVADAAVPAVATERLLLIGSAGGFEGLHLLDEGSLSLVHSMSLADLNADSLVWSPDESHVAYRRFGTVWHLEVVDLATGITTSVAPTQVGDHLSWSSDSRALAFSSNESGGDQLWRYEVDGGGVEALPTGGGVAPAWSPDGQRVAFVREGLLEVIDLESGEQRSLSSCDATCRPQWTRSGHLLARPELGVPLRWTLAGRIEFENVPLGPDENEFRATQRAPNGVASPASRAMSVVRIGGDFPDLAILEGELVAVPPITQSGVPVELFVTVRNVGSLASPASEVAIAASGPEGYYQQLQSVALAPLAPGDSLTLNAVLTLGSTPGVYQVGAEVDSLDAIAEIDESNNEGRRELGVVGEPGGSLLRLTLAREAVAFEQDLEATISVLHAGESVDALLTVVIEDELGGQVAEILDAIVSLDYAQQIDVPAVWNAEDTLAGNYRLRAVLTSESGLELASRTTDFVILAFSRLMVDISTDRATYEIGDEVDITSQLEYESGNALLADLLATTTLLRVDGSEVVSWSLALGDLLPGTSLSLPETWDSGGFEDGLYQLRFEVSGDIAEVAAAEAAILLLAPELSVEGSLTLEPDEVGLREPFVASFSILNQTANAFEAAPVRVRIVDPESGEVKVEQSALLDLVPGVPVESSFGFDSSTLGLGDHFAVLVVDLADGAGPPIQLILDGKVLRVLDLEPPEVELMDPESDGYLPADSRVVARATDALSTVTDVDLSLDGGPWLAMQPLDPEVGTYYRQLTGVLEGFHSVRARASDAAGNSSATETRAFTLDATPPAIAISGVDDEGTYSGQVSPIIAVVESHPDSQSIALNDAPYESGTPISEPGTYLLAATASDLAGNESAETVRFTLTPPTGGLTLVVNSINDVDDGLCSEQHCSLREAIHATYGDPALSTIEFDIASVSPMVIQPRTELPPLITTVVIDGLSGPGAACAPRQLLVGLDGSLLTGAGDGLRLQADDSTIRGLAITNFPGSAIRIGGSRDQLMCNHLGVDLDGEPGGNQGSGVLIDGDAATTLVGGTRSSVTECGGDCNWIAFNHGSGITVAPTALGGHRFRQNRILNNGQLAIDLGGDGVSWNDYPDDADEGPNGLLNFPALTRVVPSSPSQITVSYYGLPERDLEVEFYANEVINAGVAGLAQDPPVGELDQLVGVTLLSTDETGSGSVEVSVPFDLTNRVMTATAIDLETGSTSEASVAFLAHFTHALIAEVDALVVEGEGSLAWQTRSEAGTVAFEVLRRRRRIWESAAAPVPALSDAPQGSWYRVRVDGMLPEVAEDFVLVELGSADTRTVHGPFHVIPRMRPGLARLEAAYQRLPRGLAPTSPGGGRKAVAPSSDSSRDTLKIATTSRGIVRLDSTTIASHLGMDEGAVAEAIASGELSLSLGGEPVAWWKAADGSAIFFLSESGPPLLTAYSVHLLEVGEPGLLAEFEPPVPVDIPDDQDFWDQESFAEDLLPATASALDPTEDYWFWKGLLAGSPMDGGVVLMFALEEAIQDTAGNLTVTLYGATSVGPDEHRAQISVNGEVVADEVWEGRGWHTITAALPPGILGTDNEVQITALEQPGIDLSIFFLDRFDVEFRRHSRTSSGSLQRPGADGENFAKVSGLPSPDIRVLDTFVPGRPRLFLAPLVFREADGFSVSFRSRGAEHSYLVDSSGLGEVAPLWVEAAQVWPARDGADYVVVAPFDWLESLEPLIALRQAQGLRVAAVAIEEIFDRLNYGIPDPAVFRHLLASQEQLGIEGVRFLVVAGAGTLDPLDNLGLGGHVVPVPLGGSLHGLYAADSLIADVDGDGIADVPIGRIPATTRAELEAYIAKVVAYESQAAEPWMNTVVALADDRDGPADFGEDLRRWAEQLPPDLAVVSITLDDSDTDSARGDIFDALEAGAGALHYVGHGGSTRLAEEGLLTIEDVAVLAQGSRVPFLSALTCVANRFEIPGLPSIGGALTLDPDGGAIAVWSSTAVSQHGAAVGLGEAFARAISAPDAPPTLGEAIQRAYRDSLAAGGSPEHLSFYTLLGDPALRLRVGEMEAPQTADD
jgi:CSLREA domain-containing protein